MSDKFDSFKKWIIKIYIGFRSFFRNYAPSLFVGVSRIHYYEARERFFFLFEIIRYEGMSYKLDFPFNEYEDSASYAETIEKTRNLINYIPETSDKEKKLKKQCFTLLSSYEALVASIGYLTRRQGDLNRLWRTMTRVHVRLTCIIVQKERQLDQLYFCQEEAYRLGVENDTNVKPMLQELAESIDSYGSNNPGQKYNCVLCALIERFSTIRTGRIHQQYLNVKTYLKAFSMLMVVSIILILNHDLILGQESKSATTNKKVTVETTFLIQNKTNRNERPNGAIKAVEGDPSISTPPVAPSRGRIDIRKAAIDSTSTIADGNDKNFVGRIIKLINHWLCTNMFFFVFFAGFTGGAFSLATKARKKEREHGEDVYSSVYIVTKPFIGALGAIILYILVHTNFLTQNLIEAGMIKQLRIQGAVTFGFSFIAGFSERLVFPQFR
jgi:hypothetical protein